MEDLLMEETTPQEELLSDLPETTAEEEAQEESLEEPKYKVKYNGEEMELGVSDLITHAQKGMNYDHVRGDLEQTRLQNAETLEQLERLTSVLSEYGYSGSPQEMADLLEAQYREVDPEEVRREREALEAWQEAQLEAETARREAEAIRSEVIFSRDLAEIQQLNPNIKTLNDLGDTFFRLRAAGISNLEAFDLVSKTKSRPSHEGKEHLITTGGGTSSGGLSEIPKSELTLWKESFPEDSPAKLKERYNRAKKRQGE